jgi:hypothetical protein
MPINLPSVATADVVVTPVTGDAPPPASSASVPGYLATMLAVLVLAATAYSRAAFSRFPHPPPTHRCSPNAEGS